MSRRRLLIASPFPHFLAEFSSQLTRDFEMQRANSEEVIHFLCKEWAPHLVIFDGDSPFFNQCFLFRQKFPLEKLGLILVSRDLSVPREERAWKNGCDQVANYPAHYELLLARLHVLANRISQPQEGALSTLTPARPAPLVFEGLTIHPEDHMVKRGDQLLALTPLQFKLLLMFLNNQEQLLARQWIKENIWGDTEISLRSIDAQISKLRKMIPEIDPFLMNIYGKGYVFTRLERHAAAS